MGGNVYEWTTERYSSPEATKVSRGGFYGFTSTDEPVIGRFSSSNTRDQAVGFRVAIFIGAVDAPDKYLDDLQIGDYVALPNPTSASATASADDTGYETDQTYTISSTKNNNIRWRVLGIDSKTGEIKLIMETPLESDNEDGLLYMYGAQSYEIGYLVPDQISEKLFGNMQYVEEARSMKVEDMNELFHMANSEIGEYDIYSSRNGTEADYGEIYSYDNAYTPEIYPTKLRYWKA